MTSTVPAATAPAAGRAPGVDTPPAAAPTGTAPTGSAPTGTEARPGGRTWLVVGVGLFAGILLWLLVTSQTGPGALRNTQPLPASVHVYHYNGGLRANRPFLGWSGWTYLWQAIGFGGGTAIVGTYAVKSWRERRLHPMLGVAFAAGGMFAFDPFYNWLGYFPTNPAFLHVPHGASPWSDLAPTFEPVFFFPLYIVWLVLPALIAHGLWRRLAARGVARRGARAVMTRHPLLTLIVVCKCVTFPLDLGGFRLGCVTEAFIFSQAPGPVISPGSTGQAQLLWEPLLFELTMMATTLLLYRSRRTGRTAQEALTARLTRRLSLARRWSRTTHVLVAWSLIAVSYLGCLGGMAALRFTGQNTHLGHPWPYLDTQVYDPDGLFAASCTPGQKRPGAANYAGTRPAAHGACAPGAAG